MTVDGVELVRVLKSQRWMTALALREMAMFVRYLRLDFYGALARPQPAIHNRFNLSSTIPSVLPPSIDSHLPCSPSILGFLYPNAGYLPSTPVSSSHPHVDIGTEVSLHIMSRGSFRFEPRSSLYTNARI